MCISKPTLVVLATLILAGASASQAAADGRAPENSGRLKGDPFVIEVPPAAGGARTKAARPQDNKCRFGLCYPDFPVPSQPTRLLSGI